MYDSHARVNKRIDLMVSCQNYPSERALYLKLDHRFQLHVHLSFIRVVCLPMNNILPDQLQRIPIIHVENYSLASRAAFYALSSAVI